MNNTIYSHLVEVAVKEKLDIFDLALKECHPFVFMPSNSETTEVGEVSEFLDLPYPIISIEVLDAPLTSPKPGEEPVWITMLLVKEISPKFYMFMVYTRSFINGVPSFKVFSVTSDDKEAFENLNFILKDYLKKLSTWDIGTGPRQAKMKVKTGKDKYFWKPKAITIVSPKRLVSAAEKSFTHIDWSHQWEVRGHWRTIEGVGKDRAGNYNIKGFTWINSHTKGPENKPLIKKTYLVKDS